MGTYTYQKPIADAELYRRRIQDWLRHPLVWAALALAIGLFLGTQAGGVSQRYVKLAVALGYAFVLIRFPTIVGVGLYLVTFPFPAAIVIGDTNFVFASFLAVIWMIRVGLRQDPLPRRTYLDWAILAYLAAHLISLVNVADMEGLNRSLQAIRHLAVPILFYYVLVNAGRAERKLLFLSRMLTLSLMALYFTAFMERFFPAIEYIPRWYVSVTGARELFAEGVVEHRIGGITTHALMGDLAAFGCILQTFLAVRSKGHPWRRAFHWVLAAASIYVVSLTGNRGALIALAVGAAYFFWIFSAELSWKRVFVGSLVAIGMLFVGEKTLGRFEGNITLLTRLFGTYLERGVPDTRRMSWSYAWQKIMERPWLGHGPFYNLQSAALSPRAIWPHNAFLFYFFTIGIVGLPTYLYLCWRVVRRTWVGRGLRIGEISLARGLTAVMHVGIIIFLTGQLRTDHQREDVYAIFMWILFGVGILAREVWEEAKRERRGRHPAHIGS